MTTGFGVELEAVNPKRSVCEPFREAIELGLSRGRDATAIWQHLVSESGFDGGYQTVKRCVRKLRGKQPPQPRAVILTGPGEESQVDYGTGAMVRDPKTRKYRRTRLFVMVLGCSRKAARFLTFRSSSRIWAELHEKAFRRLGGATRVVVLDFVPGNKIELMCPVPLCGRGGRGPHQSRAVWRSGEHNRLASAHHGLPFGISERRLSCSNATS